MSETQEDAERDDLEAGASVPVQASRSVSMPNCCTRRVALSSLHLSSSTIIIPTKCTQTSVTPSAPLLAATTVTLLLLCVLTKIVIRREKFGIGFRVITIMLTQCVPNAFISIHKLQ